MNITEKQKQKIAIVRDALKQIEAEKFQPTARVYADLPSLYKAEVGTELQDHLKKRVTHKSPCEVCAIGAMFLSAIRLHDRFKITQEIKDNGEVSAIAMKKNLGKFFSSDELKILESSFEIYAAVLSEDLQDQFLNAYDYRYFLTQLDDRERLIWLLESVIALKGKFTLTDLIERSSKNTQ